MRPVLYRPMVFARGKDMGRKPTALIAFKLRMREWLRVQIEEAAKARGTSMNSEIVRRLEQSFETHPPLNEDDMRAATRIARLAVSLWKTGESSKPKRRKKARRTRK